MNRIQKAGLNRIISGRQVFKLPNGKEFLYLYPTLEQIAQAEEYKADLEEELKFSGFLTDAQTLSYLISLGVWDNLAEQMLEKLEHQIEDAKVAMYKYGRNKDTEKRLKKARKSYNDLWRKRHALDANTKEGFVQSMGNQRLLMACTFLSGKSILELDIPAWEFNLYLNEYNKYSLDMRDIRIISKNDPWASIWSIGKEEAFKKPAVELSDEQRILINVSRMYDNAYQYHEPPPQDVIDDDDRFDGWLIYIKKENNRKRAQSSLDDSLPQKIAGSQEIFLTAENEEEAARIFELNRGADRHRILQRQQMVKQRGSVREKDLPDALERAREQTYGQ
jgi:hypothetical protein